MKINRSLSLILALVLTPMVVFALPLRVNTSQTGGPELCPGGSFCTYIANDTSFTPGEPMILAMRMNFTFRGLPAQMCQCTGDGGGISGCTASYQNGECTMSMSSTIPAYAMRPGDEVWVTATQAPQEPMPGITGSYTVAVDSLSRTPVTGACTTPPTSISSAGHHVLTFSKSAGCAVS